MEEKNRVRKREVFLLIIWALILIIIFQPIRSKIIDWQVNSSFKEITSQVENQVQEKLGYLLTQAKEISDLSYIRQQIKDKDVLDFLGVLNNERKNRGIDTMLITDGQGIALSRVPANQKRGDNIFLLTPFGRKLAKGEEIISVINGQTKPMILAAGLPMFENNEIFGALVAGQEVSDSYAEEFRNSLSQSERIELAFYTDDKGVISSTFENKEANKLIATHYNLGSFLGEENFNTHQVEIDSNKYFVDRVVFSGIEESPGGVLIFYDQNLLLDDFLGALVLLIILIFIFVIYQLIKRRGVKLKSIVIISLITVIIGLSINCIFTQKIFFPSVDMKETVNTIYNSTLNLEPEFDIFDIYKEHNISIEIVPGGEAINAVATVLNFDPKMIFVEEIITTRSFCPEEMFIEKEINNKIGRVSIKCALPTPGFQELQGIVADIHIVSLKEGNFSLNFNKEETQVLANDGLGTNVLRTAIGGSYFVNQNTSSKNSNKVLVASSHSNSEKWYNDPKINFFWPRKEGKKFAYSFDQNKSTTPLKDKLTEDNSINYLVEESGKYYFHIAELLEEGSLGTVTHFQVNIDLDPPIYDLLVSEKTVSVGDIVRLEFQRKDDFDGIGFNQFYIKINNSTFFPSASPLFIPFSKSGDQNIVVRAFDRAENYTDKEVNIKVKEKSFVDNIINFDFRSLFR